MALASLHYPAGLAAIAGGITAILCTSVFLAAFPITIPAGIVGGCLTAQLFLCTKLGRPVALFSELRRERLWNGR